MTAAPLRARLATGAGLMIGASILGRFLSMLSVAVLARLLTPADFGMIAYATIAAELLRIFSGAVFATALVRLETIDRTHVDTAFTLALMTNGAAALALTLGAAPLARLLGAPALGPVLATLALIPLIEALRTPRFLLLARELRFDWVAGADVIGRLVVAGVAIGMAVLLQSYWAMVWALIAASAVGTLLGHLVAPGPLALGLARWRDCIGFGGWSIAQSVTAFANRSLGPLVVGGALGLAALGVFRLGLNLVNQLFRQLAQPIDHMVYTGLSQRRRDKADLRRAYLDTQGLVFALFLPMGVGVALTAPELLRVLAGPGWQGAVPVLQILAPAMAVGLLRSGMGGMVSALGLARLNFLREALVIAVTLPALFLGLRFGGLVGVILAAALAEIVSVAVMLPAVARLTGGRLLDTVRRGARTAAAAALMAASVLAVGWLMGPAPGEPGLAAALGLLAGKAAVGALVYGGAHLALWQAAGRPEGVETTALTLARSLAARFRRGRAAQSAIGPE